MVRVGLSRGVESGVLNKEAGISQGLFIEPLPFLLCVGFRRRVSVGK